MRPVGVALAVTALILGSLAATAAPASTGSITTSKVVDVSGDQTAQANGYIYARPSSGLSQARSLSARRGQA